MSESNKKRMSNMDKVMKGQNVKSSDRQKVANNYSVPKKDSNEKGYKYQDSKKIKYSDQNQGFNYYLLPLLFVLSVLPLIATQKTFDPKIKQFIWGENIEKAYDYFLYYKHWLLVATVSIMVCILVWYLWSHKYKKPLHYSIGLIPLGIYALLSLLSAFFSDYSYFSFHGSMDQFESVFALLGYCTLVFYAFQFVRTENDIKVLVKFLLFSVLILVTLGITQFIGKDFFGSELGTRILTGGKAGKGGLNFVFGPHRVYLTLYNPNYVGVYAALIAPIFLVLLLFSKRLVSTLLNLTVLIGIIVCVMGAQSLAGIISIAVAMIGIVIVMWRYLLKRLYITVPLVLLLVVAMVFINHQTGNAMTNRIKDALRIQKATAPNITSMTADADQVSITYKGNDINFSMISDEENTMFFHLVKDGNGMDLPYVFDETDGYYDVQDDRFSEISFTEAIFGDVICLDIRVDGKDWVFSNKVGDGSYYILNRFQKWDKLYQHKENLLTGYEGFASGRGYIWSRTLPLLKKYALLGSGPDTYTMAFPQNDYLGFYNHGYESQFITKPHSLYLQIAVQTGLLSLIAFLAFYGIYFVTSIRLYLRGRFNSYYAQVGVAIFVGTFAYMITGLTNDSSITTAPVFWCLMGLGLVVNEKAKPLILEESKRIKEEKANSINKKQGTEAETLS